jgi:hypothetical protein
MVQLWKNGTENESGYKQYRLSYTFMFEEIEQCAWNILQVCLTVSNS